MSNRQKRHKYIFLNNWHLETNILQVRLLLAVLLFVKRKKVILLSTENHVITKPL